MTGDCPDKGCHRIVEDLRDTMYKDQEGGVRYDIRHIRTALEGVVRKWHVWVFFAGMMIAIVPTYVALARTVFLYTPASETAAVCDRVSRLEERYNYLVEGINGLKIDQGLILQELRKMSVSMQDTKTTIRHEYDSTERVKME